MSLSLTHIKLNPPELDEFLNGVAEFKLLRDKRGWIRTIKEKLWEMHIFDVVELMRRIISMGGEFCDIGRPHLFISTLDKMARVGTKLTLKEYTTKHKLFV